MKEFLDYFENRNPLSTKDSSYEPFHIFRRLIDHFEKELSFDEKVQLFLHFEKYEQCLKYSRNREYAKAALLLDQIQRIDNNFPEIVKNGMLSLYHAMYAYYVYINNEYDNAIKNLEIAIKYSKQQGKVFPLMLGSVQEQWLNIIRVFISINNLTMIIQESKALFEFSLYGTGLEEETILNFRNLEYGMHTLMLHHIFNNIFEGVLKLYNNDLHASEKIYKEIVFHLFNNHSLTPLNMHVAKIVALLNDFYQNNKQSFLDSLISNFESLQKSPSILKKLALIYYVDTVSNLGIDITGHKNYSNFSRIYSGLGVNQSGKYPVVP